MRWIVSLLISACFVLPAADWQVTFGSLWGGAGDEAMRACVVTDDGVAIVGGNGLVSVPGVPVHDLGGKGGVLVRIDTMLGEVLSITTFRSPVTSLALSDDNHVLVAADTSYKLSLDGATVAWKGGGGGKRICRDGSGGAWIWSGSSAIHLDNTGKQVGSVSCKGKDFAVDPDGERVFVCGFNAGRSKKSGNPVHVPWVRAFDFSGSKVWQMWGFTPTEVDEVGDMADSHPQRLFFSQDGHLYMFGDSDGGNTPYRHGSQTPGQSPGSTLKGTPFNETWRAFRSTRMLFVCRIDPSNGEILRGSFFYGMYENDEPKRLEVGDGQAQGLYVDKDGRVFLSGVMRCKLPWTANAVHKQAAPMDRLGYYKNKSAADEMYCTIIDENFSNLAFCSGFNQGDQGIFASQGLCVAGNAHAAVVVGWMKQPATGADPASATAFLKSPVQTSYGGGKDGYIATLSTRRPPTDPVALIRLLLDRMYPDVTGPGIETLRTSEDFALAIEQLHAAGDQRSKLVATMVERVGTQTLERAKTIISTEPVTARAQLEQISQAWAGTDMAITAANQVEAIKKDKTLKELIKIGEIKEDCLALIDQFVNVEAAQSSYLDQAWTKENKKVAGKLIKAAGSMAKKWPGHRYTAEILASCQAYHLPITAVEQDLFKNLILVTNARRSLPDGVRRKVDWSDAKVQKKYKRALEAIRKAVTAMRGTNTDHAFSVRATTIAAGVGISFDKKQKKR